MKPFHDHFSEVAGQYADYRPHYPAALFDFFATLVPRDALVWDCAAGSGQATIDLADRFDRVVATDASGEQLASAPPRPNVEYRVAPAEHSGLNNASIGLLTVAQALHWFDLDRFYAEGRRVLADNGLIAIWTYGMSTVEGDEVNDLLQDYYANIVGRYWPPERKLVEAGYRTIAFPFEELTTPAFRMEARWTLAQVLGYLGTWSATNRYIKATGRNPLGPLEAALKEVWPAPDQPRLLVWPLFLRFGRKRA